MERNGDARIRRPLPRRPQWKPMIPTLFISMADLSLTLLKSTITSTDPQIDTNPLIQMVWYWIWFWDAMLPVHDALLPGITMVLGCVATLYYWRRWSVGLSLLGGRGGMS